MCDQWSAECFIFIRQILQFSAPFLLLSQKSENSQQLQMSTVYMWPSNTKLRGWWKESWLVIRLTAFNITSLLNIDNSDRWRRKTLMGADTVWHPSQLVKHINLFAPTSHDLYESLSCLDEETGAQPCPYSNKKRSHSGFLPSVLSAELGSKTILLSH